MNVHQPESAPRAPTISTSHPFGGVYASTICPMTPQGVVDETALAAHLKSVVTTAGMAGLLVNGHAGENFALSRDEQSTVMRIAREASGERKIVAGINAESTDLAVQLSEDAAKAGADAVMVFPPYSWALGADDRVIQGHHRAIAKASNLPVFLFQGSVNSGRTAFTQKTLSGLLEIDSVVGIKEGSWETAAYEATRRLTKKLRPDVGVMASGDEHLFTCFAIGSEGSLVSLAAVIPELIVELERAMLADDIAAGRAIHERLYDLARIVYGAPGHLATLRLKTCLVLLGRLETATSRSPIKALSAEETELLRAALATAGVLEV
ncbi:dihydrodipicolinate synthase family protein [Aquamicrobium sp. LC103]|uniref:dihydrodipicolinate synthase family protein n=1 Tax=Aquamicrobium sp. LC103 TaxID=1120658 RepID=UPI00063EC4BA|nr:dihydrodipicolinate synthase family protein [Aquamicrobium sp. LC103]TKT74403.1 dihydrodipicolinate synthase family protein [Aquamicrobium sp. LC103]